ncbi:MAG: ZPR1 zinc finger domain-containing protein [Nanoarchaeota archaeon]|nr:ZPR1 zinc finger domain-containing protein [Nanoarchaeota archaeon]
MTDQSNELKGQPCPMCNKKTLTLMEAERDVPFFGKVYLFSMTCSTCKYYKSDIELAEKHEPAKYTLEVSNEEDLKIRVIKAASATVKIPHIATIEPGASSNGYVTNVEGIINRVKAIIEQKRDMEEDSAIKKKAKNLLKKINKVLWGQDKLKIIISDPNGNSAIISDKAKKSKI